MQQSLFKQDDETTVVMKVIMANCFYDTYKKLLQYPPFYEQRTKWMIDFLWWKSKYIGNVDCQFQKSTASQLNYSIWKKITSKEGCPLVSYEVSFLPRKIFRFVQWSTDFSENNLEANNMHQCVSTWKSWTI